MTIEELYELLRSDESYRIERTVSTGNMDKFQEAICAFANDLPGSRKKGYLLRDDEKSYEESVHSVSLNATCEQLKANLNPDGKLLIISLSDTIASMSEIKLKPLLKPLYEKKSNTLLKDKVIYPLIKLGLVAQTHPETPRHPKQKYYLTGLGNNMLAYLRNTDCME